MEKFLCQYQVICKYYLLYIRSIFLCATSTEKTAPLVAIQLVYRYCILEQLKSPVFPMKHPIIRENDVKMLQHVDMLECTMDPSDLLKIGLNLQQDSYKKLTIFQKFIISNC